MDLQSLFKPIAVPKPLKGREMRSTIIPKDTLTAMKVVSAKTLEDKEVDFFREPGEEVEEIYHEGYIEGKLYLVPDSNLQAMRDIVNAKMRRKQSSASKLRASVNKPTPCSKLTAKFDSLLDKIDQLAESSSDESSDEQKRISNIRKKSKQLRAEKNQKLVQDEDAVPPILDENIKYKRVKPKYSSEKKDYDEQSNTVQQTPSSTKSLIEDDYEAWKPPVGDTNYETFRLIVSGHFHQGKTPMFIIHENNDGINILENCTPDFKSHKQEENIHIVISGKFFTEKTLIEGTDTSPPILNVKRHSIVIEDQTNIHMEKFKDIYTVGPVDIALEGEFVKKDSKYTPVLSLEVMKLAPIPEAVIDNDIPTTVLYAKQTHNSPINENTSHKVDQEISKIEKHVHYAEEKQQSKPKTLFGQIKEKILNKTLFFRSKEDPNKDMSMSKSSKSDNELKTSSFPLRSSLSFERKANFRGKRGKNKKSRRLNVIRKLSRLRLSTTKDDYHEIQHTKSPFKSKKDSLETHTTDDREDILRQSKAHVVKKKKKNKNQAIVENPILAQMQEFFLA